MPALPISRPFGTLPSRESVEAWTLEGASGLTIEVITYGGIVTKLLVPDADSSGQKIDVVLGFSDLESYLSSRSYFGAITGRVAGRITGARFLLDGETFELARNDPPNHLHGGLEGFNKKLWIAVPVLRPDGAPSLRLTYSSPDGDQGYPGTVNVSVIYTVTNDNAFWVETEATTDSPTPLSLTHHAYFNLAAEDSGNIVDHQLQVHAGEFVPIDEQYTLLDRFEPVNGGNDLRSARRLGDVIPLFFKEHGALYPVRRCASDNALVQIARLLHPRSGRVLTCSTSCPYLQIYTAAHLDGSEIGKSGGPYQKYAGLCLECEGYANGANASHMGDVIVRPGVMQRYSTAYAFSRIPTQPQ